MASEKKREVPALLQTVLAADKQASKAVFDAADARKGKLKRED